MAPDLLWSRAMRAPGRSLGVATVVAMVTAAGMAVAQPEHGDDDPGDDAAAERARALEAQARTRRQLARVFTPTVGTATWALSAATGTRGEYSDTGYQAATAEVSVAADVDLVAAYGRYSSRLATGGEARLRTGGNEPRVSLLHRGFVRPWEFGMMRLELDHQFVWQGTPELSSRRDVWRRPYSREDLRVMFTMLHWRFETHRLGFQLGRIEEAPTLIWQHDGAMDKRQLELRSDWSLLWLERRAKDPHGLDMGVNLLAITQEAIKGDEQAAVTQYLYARARAVPLGGSGLYVSGAVGRSSITPYVQVSGSFGEATFITDDLPAFSATTGYGRIHGAVGPALLDAGFERALYLTFDAELALEDRAYANIELPARRGRLALGLFAADTTVWSSADSADTARTGGGSAALRYPVSDGWTLRIDAELARSFYASLHGDARPTPSLGIRGGFTLAKSLGRTHTSRAPSLTP